MLDKKVSSSSQYIIRPYESPTDFNMAPDVCSYQFYDPINPTNHYKMKLKITSQWN